jgi:hypothetical protein
MSRMLDRRTSEAIETELGGGEPLPGATADGDQVRLHDDTKAADLAKGLGAVAFTFGRDIFLAADAPELESPAGDRLLRHELTHVRQQQAAGTTRPRRVSAPGSPAERQAAAAAGPAQAAVASTGPQTVHRQESPEEEEEVRMMTSETVHREVAVDEMEVEVEEGQTAPAVTTTTPAVPTPTEQPGTGEGGSQNPPANPAAAALFEATVMGKLRSVAENLAGDRPNPLESHRALRDAAAALDALSEAYKTSDPLLSESISKVHNGILVVREVLSPMAGLTRDLKKDIVPMLPGMVESAAGIKDKLH